jgi:hypothetical protein
MAQAARKMHDERETQIDIEEIPTIDVIHAFDDVLATLDDIITMTEAAFAQDDAGATRH